MSLGNRLGYLPDPPKKRGESPDWDAAALSLGAVDLPERHSNREWFRAPFDQGGLGSCTAQAVAMAIYVSHRRQGILNPIICSRLALYYLGRATHGMTHFDSGTFIRAVIEILNLLGFSVESLWPYEPDRFAEQPPTDVFKYGIDQTSDRTPTAYWRIYQTGHARVAAVKRAVANGDVIVFGTDVSRAFISRRGPADGAVVDPPTPAQVAGGHAMCIGGYDDALAAFDVISSYGDEWADEGWCRLSYDYIAWEKTRDLWIIRHAPPYPEDIYE